jgi:hypothetical protein
MSFIDIEESRVLPSVGDEAVVAREEVREVALVRDLGRQDGKQVKWSW